jgi:hypothetical protein
MQVADIIKEELWPNPSKYFNNVSAFSDKLFILFGPFFSCGSFCHVLLNLPLQESEEEFEEEEDEEVILFSYQ